MGTWPCFRPMSQAPRVFIKKTQGAEHRAQIAVRYTLRFFSYIIYLKILFFCSISYQKIEDKKDSGPAYLF